MKQYALPENGFSTKEEQELFWREVLRAQKKSKLTQIEFCRLSGLKLTKFKYWRKVLNKKTEAKQTGFVQVQIKEEPKEAIAETVDGLEIQLITGEIIKLRGSPLTVLLKTVLKVLKEVSC